MYEDLLIITNLENDLIYKFTSAQTLDKEMELLLFSYAALDIFEEILSEQVQYFYDSIDKYLKSKVSLLLLPSGYKIIFVNEWENMNLIFEFLKAAHKELKNVILDAFADENCSIFDIRLRKLYEEYKTKI